MNRPFLLLLVIACRASRGICRPFGTCLASDICTAVELASHLGLGQSNLIVFWMGYGPVPRARDYSRLVVYRTLCLCFLQGRRLCRHLVLGHCPWWLVGVVVAVCLCLFGHASKSNWAACSGRTNRHNSIGQQDIRLFLFPVPLASPRPCLCLQQRLFRPAAREVLDFVAYVCRPSSF